MKMLTVMLTALLVSATSAQGQGQADFTRLLVVGGNSWDGGEPGPLPVRIKFFSSTPEAPLDSAAVLKAATAAMFAAGLPPDANVYSVGEAQEEGRHLRIEVNAYRAGEVRYEAVVFDGRQEAARSCGREAQWRVTEPLLSALHLSHRIRTTVECVKSAYGIRWN